MPTSEITKPLQKPDSVNGFTLFYKKVLDKQIQQIIHGRSPQQTYPKAGSHLTWTG